MEANGGDVREVIVPMTTTVTVMIAAGDLDLVRRVIRAASAAGIQPVEVVLPVSMLPSYAVTSDPFGIAGVPASWSEGGGEVRLILSRETEETRWRG